MAANDVTVSLAAASDASIRVHRVIKQSTNTLPKSVSITTIAANANSVFTLAPGESLIVERVDHIESLMKAMPLKSKEGHAG
jgi:hypothetical protein